MNSIKYTQESKLIPTYVTYPDEQNPIFFEKRNVQGASGTVFPMAMNTRMEAAFRPEPYNMLTLENEYIQTTLLPELGGRIYTAVDKTNGYDFIYRNQNIKPQQIGLCGPWVSGGIEFNWPQHHRPTTFKAVDWCVEQNEDGSKTVWMGEIEPFNRTKGMVGVTVYPGKSYIQAKIRLFNRTPYRQTFMWWANLAVAVNEKYRSIFPEDIHWSSGHAWATTTTFPKLKGLYRGLVDYGKEGVDVQDFSKLTLGDSFFTYNSQYDFLAGYDYGKSAGIVHVADRHVSPGKKMFTWGVSDFSRAWFDNLSDADGPYIELMTGVYTCNQPDFSWIAPFEYKTAEQYWYPVRDIKNIKSANLNGAIGFELENGKIEFALNTTELRKQSNVTLTCKDTIIYQRTIDISPDAPFCDTVEVPVCNLWELELTLCTAQGINLVSYRPEEPPATQVPATLPPTPYPEKMDNAEDIYIHALHLYQYRHPYFDPMDYLKKALLLDPNHAACNNLAGKIMMERGEFAQAEIYFNKAIAILTQRDPNPYDTEPYYNLGLLLKMTGHYDEAYQSLYKAVWSFANKSSGYYELAEISCIRGDYTTALEHLEQSINSNGTNFKTLKLQAMVLRKLKKYQEALEALEKIYRYDRLDFIALYEKCKLLKEMQSVDYDQAEATLLATMRNTPEYYLDIAIDYASAGFFADAIEAVELGITNRTGNFPILEYYQAYYLKLSNSETATQVLKKAATLPVAGCLHSRLESIAVLEYATQANPSDAVAPYLLGNIFYGRKSFQQGIACFEKSVAREATFPTAYRNLAIGYFDKCAAVEEAGKLIAKAFEMNPSDARVFFELTQYQRNINLPVDERLALFEQHRTLADISEDIYAKFVATLVEAGEYERAIAMLRSKVFHPYEGGEGVLAKEYSGANLLLGMGMLQRGELAPAASVFFEVGEIPKNFNTGKIPGKHQHAHAEYYMGLVQEQLGNTKQAKEHFTRAANDRSTPEMWYYAGLALQKLGEAEKSRDLLNGILNAAEELLLNHGRYAYFTKTLVTTLPFEHNTERNDCALAYYYKGLAYLALGDAQQAKHNLEHSLSINGCNYMAKHYLEML